MDKDFELMYAGYNPTADALANGQIVATGMPSGPPTSAITKLMAGNSGKFTILNITPDEAKKMDGAAFCGHHTRLRPVLIRPDKRYPDRCSAQFPGGQRKRR